MTTRSAEPAAIDRTVRTHRVAQHGRHQPMTRRSGVRQAEDPIESGDGEDLHARRARAQHLQTDGPVALRPLVRAHEHAQRGRVDERHALRGRRRCTGGRGRSGRAARGRAVPTSRCRDRRERGARSSLRSLDRWMKEISTSSAVSIGRSSLHTPGAIPVGRRRQTRGDCSRRVRECRRERVSP